MENTTKSILLTPFNWLYKCSPEACLKLLFRIKQGYKLDLKDPKTYSEKLQWIKLYDHNPLMPECCDKYAVREYVRRQGCEETLNHLIWEGFDPAQIPFDSLPKKCVIKATHGSTFNIICTDTAALDRSQTVEKCRKWLNTKFLPCYGEWFYGQVRPRIIVEDYIESDDGRDLKDYKFFCFHGEPKICQVHLDRFSRHRSDMYDADWNYLEGKNTGYPCSGIPIPRPARWEDALKCARKLSAPFHHARIDLFLENDRVYFGEITFTPGAGFNRLSSMDFNREMGSWLLLDTAGASCT